MNGSVAQLLDTVRRSLREAVQPELQSDHARSQLAGALDILAKLERMTDWSAAMQLEEQLALEVGMAAMAASAGAAGIALPVPAAADAGDRLEPADLAASQACMRQWIDWRFDAALPESLQSDLDRLLRSALRDAAAAQRRRIPRADFSSMTASTD